VRRVTRVVFQLCRGDESRLGDKISLAHSSE